MRKLLVLGTLMLGTAIAHASTDTVSSTTYDQFNTTALGAVTNAVERVPDQAAVFAAFAASAASNGCATGIERCATPMTLSNCPPGMYWTTEGTGIAHCIYPPPPPPPPEVYVPWEPPTVVGDSGGGGGGGGGGGEPASSAPFDYCAAYGWCADAPLASATPAAPPPPPDPLPPQIVEPPDPCLWCATEVIHTPAPTTTAPPAPAPEPERLVWAIGSTQMGQAAGPDAAAQYAQGEAYGHGQFNYVSSHYGNGDNVPYPVQTWSEYTASMVASGCSPSTTDISGFECR